MTGHPPFLNIPLALAAAMAASLAACGGGGGNSGGPPAAIVMTAANQDSVAHAAAVSYLTLGPAQAIPYGGGAPAPSLQPLLRLSHGVTSALANTGRRHVQDATSTRPLATIGPVTQPCAVAGSTTLSIDDHDNDGHVTPGDSIHFTFAGCQDDVKEVLDGAVDIVLTSVGSGSLPSFSGNMTFTRFADEALDHSHGASVDGTATLGYAQTGLSTESVTLTALAGLVSTVHAHQLGTDTISFMDGFRSVASVDAAAAPPAASSSALYGATTSTISGAITSQAAGGWFNVSTDSPIVYYNADSYPRAGAMVATGSRGRVVLTVESATTVRVDLDANDDGTAEASNEQAWDWLF